MFYKSQSGSALIQLVIATAVLGILTMTIGGIIQNSQDEQMIVVHRAAREKLSESIKNILYAHQYCACAFQGVNIDPNTLAPVNVAELSIYSQNCAQNLYTLARVGQRLNGAKVTNIALRNIVASGTSYNSDLVIESENPYTKAQGADRIPFQFTGTIVGRNLNVTTCASPEMRPSKLVPLNAGSVYLKHNPNGPRENYRFEELVGTGKQTILAKLDLRWGRNFTLRIYTPGVTAPQIVDVSTGVDGHIRHDSSTIKMTVVDGNFAATLDCRTNGCADILDNSRAVDSINRITPKAILLQTE